MSTFPEIPRRTRDELREHFRAEMRALKESKRRDCVECVSSVHRGFREFQAKRCRHVTLPLVRLEKVRARAMHRVDKSARQILAILIELQRSSSVNIVSFSDGLDSRETVQLPHPSSAECATSEFRALHQLFQDANGLPPFAPARIADKYQRAILQLYGAVLQLRSIVSELHDRGLADDPLPFYDTVNERGSCPPLSVSLWEKGQS